MFTGSVVGVFTLLVGKCVNRELGVVNQTWAPHASGVVASADARP